MTDEVLTELWIAKDNIAKEHGYNIDALAEYFIREQSSHHGRIRGDERDPKAQQEARPDRMLPSRR
jgi:hypothetical protein